jgi:hypothetical protein
LILEEDQIVSRPPATRRLGVYHAYNMAEAARDAIEGLAVPGGAVSGRQRGAGSSSYRELRASARAEREAFDRASGEEAVEFSERLSRLKQGRLSDKEKEFLDEKVQPEGVRIQQAGDKTFYLQADRWIDSALTTADLADEQKLERIKYLSDEYFALLKEHKGIGKYLCVGPLVTFVWQDKLISIVE